MTISAAIDSLQKLLERCIVKVSTNRDQGTGFIVQHQLAVTCRHVVEGLAENSAVTVLDWQGRPIPATIKRTYPPADASVAGADRWPDLALLQLGTEADDLEAVLLDAGDVSAGSTVYVGGYPAKSIVEYQLRDFEAGPALSRDAQHHRYMALKAESVDSGFSGAPMLSETGFVTGIVRLSRAPGTPLGGWVVPISEVLPHVAELAAAYEVPGRAGQTWSQLLTAATLKEHGRDADGSRLDAHDRPPPMIDLELSREVEAGPTDAWNVKVSSSARTFGKRVCTADLGSGILDAIDHWSRRHTLSTTQEVELVGRVLYRAIMPDDVSSELAALGGGPPPLLRLRADEGFPLAAIPWEYAASHQFCMGTTERWAFSRFIPEDRPRLPRADKVRGLIAVNSWNQQIAEEIGQELRELLAPLGRLELAIEANRPFQTFSTLLEQRRWDIVHYIGTRSTDGSLTFPKPYGGSVRQRVPGSNVRKAILKGDVKVVVLQFDDGPTITRSSPTADFLDLLRELPYESAPPSPRAVVVAEHATTRDHVLRFSNTFYERLADGDSVENAVQATRRQLQAEPPPDPRDDELDDPAAFGTVSVVTTQEGDVRLLTRGSKLKQPGVGAGSIRQESRASATGGSLAAGSGAEDGGTYQRAGFER